MPILGTIASSKLSLKDNYESIATATVGSGGATYVEFTSIPTTFTHLQIRGYAKFDNTADINFRVGAGSIDTGTNYNYHGLYALGNNKYSLNSTNSPNGVYVGYYITGNDNFSGFVVDLLDYRNTNKNKSFKSWQGSTNASNGIVMVNGSVWRSTSAIDVIRIYSSNTVNLSQYSHFGLYGIGSK